MHDDAAETTGRRLVKNRFVKSSNKPGADYRRSAPGFCLRLWQSPHLSTTSSHRFECCQNSFWYYRLSANVFLSIVVSSPFSNLVIFHVLPSKIGK